MMPSSNMKNAKRIGLAFLVVSASVISALVPWAYFSGKSYSKKFRAEINARLEMTKKEIKLGTLNPKKEFFHVLESDEGLMIIQIFGKRDSLDINMVGKSGESKMFTKYRSLVDLYKSSGSNMSKLEDFAKKQEGRRTNGIFSIQSTFRSCIFNSPGLIERLGLSFVDGKVVSIIKFYEKFCELVKSVYLESVLGKSLTVLVAFNRTTLNISYPVYVTANHDYGLKSTRWEIYTFDYTFSQNSTDSSDIINVREIGAQLTATIILQALFATIYSLGDI